MLVLTRKKDEVIVIGDEIEIIITEIYEDRVKIGINAPKNMKIFRKELLEEVENENIKSTQVEIDLKNIKGLVVGKKED